MDTNIFYRLNVFSKDSITTYNNNYSLLGTCYIRAHKNLILECKISKFALTNNIGEVIKPFVTIKADTYVLITECFIYNNKELIKCKYLSDLEFYDTLYDQ
jgi:hypothetical protein